ncbi:MAG TPA: hypothetical protein VLX68_00140 [Chitinivibrionales bacterium]|nr:hypothetical protein [Chitinivibrionales bacterium]
MHKVERLGVPPLRGVGPPSGLAFGSGCHGARPLRGAPGSTAL